VSEKFEDTKWIIRCRKSKKDRQRSGERRKTKDNYLQNTTQKATDRATRSHYKPRGGPLVGLAVPVPLVALARVGLAVPVPLVALAMVGLAVPVPLVALYN
jgi:hypothetical protein